MGYGCDRVRLKTLSRKFDKWKCIWCGQKQTVKKGEPPEDRCDQTGQRMKRFSADPDQ
jgi:hypothetical protein